MSFSKLVYVDSNNDEEVSLILELTSILQLQHNQKTSLSIRSQRNLNHLIDQYLWNEKPWITPEEEVGVRVTLVDNSLSFLDGEKRYPIPPHLLQTKVKSRSIQTAVIHTIARCVVEKKFSDNRPTKIISLVHTDEVKDWLSLLEATEALMAYWYKNRDHETELELVDLSAGLDPQIAKKVSFLSEVTVILKISPTTSHFIKLLRTINPKSKLVIHAFESASVYFANTFLYGIEQFLYQEDLWLMSCEADQKLAKLAWKSINSEVVPLRAPEIHLNSFQQSSQKDLLYFGRISEQKNIHEILFAISLIADKMRNEKRKLKIYGYEDFLGVQNLRIPSLGYLELLFKLTKDLSISDLVEFHQPIPQSKISEALTQGIFISLSVHSDENFGLVAYRALDQGTPVILSAWGGHLDLEQSFSEMSLVPVYQTATGPKSDPFELSKIILKVLDGRSSPKKKNRQLFTLGELKDPKVHLSPSDLKIEVHHRIENQFPWIPRKWPLYGQIFGNFSDPAYLKAMECYGAIPLRNTRSNLVSPFVAFSAAEIKVTDCSAGVLSYPRKEEKRDKQLKQFGTGKVFDVSDSELRWLSGHGYVF